MKSFFLALVLPSESSIFEKVLWIFIHTTKNTFTVAGAIPFSWPCPTSSSSVKLTEGKRQKAITHGYSW